MIIFLFNPATPERYAGEVCHSGTISAKESVTASYSVSEFLTH